MMVVGGWVTREGATSSNGDGRNGVVEPKNRTVEADCKTLDKIRFPTIYLATTMRGGIVELKLIPRARCMNDKWEYRDEK